MTTAVLESESTASSAEAPTASDPPRELVEPDEQPLELILARNLVSIVSLAAFLVDVEGHIVF